MKAKRLILVPAAIAAVALAACGGGSSTTSTDECIFGDLPALYEKAEKKVLTDFKDVKDVNDVMPQILSIYEETEKQAKPLIEKMVGKKIAYNVSDSLPYQVVSDIVVEGASASESSSVKVKVTFDVALTQDLEEPLTVYYFLQDDEKPIGSANISNLKKQTAGDTVHIRTTINSPKIPAKYLEGCNNLKFVSKETYLSQMRDIAEQNRQWYNEGEKEKSALMGNE